MKAVIVVTLAIIATAWSRRTAAVALAIGVAMIALGHAWRRYGGDNRTDSELARAFGELVLSSGCAVAAVAVVGGVVLATPVRRALRACSCDRAD